MKKNRTVLKILFGTAIVAVLTGIVVVSLAWLWASGMTSGVVDDGEHMGHVLRDAAVQLRRSGDTELVVEYQPMTGIQQEYSVDFRASSNPTGEPRPGTSYVSYGKEYVSVGGERNGSTTYHQLWVYVSDNFKVFKKNEATFITLRKNGERIDVVEVR